MEFRIFCQGFPAIAGDQRTPRLDDRVRVLGLARLRAARPGLAVVVAAIFLVAVLVVSARLVGFPLLLVLALL